MLDDADEIRNLIHAYGERLDAGDLDGVADLFERATLRSTGRAVALRGTRQVRGVYDDVILYGGIPCTKHVISNLAVAVDGSQGRAQCYFTVLQARPDLPLQPILAGRYHDRFERRDSRWWFTDRVILPDLVGDLSHHMRRRPVEQRPPA
jgi:hypothetical protein